MVAKAVNARHGEASREPQPPADVPANLEGLPEDDDDRHEDRVNLDRVREARRDARENPPTQAPVAHGPPHEKKRQHEERHERRVLQVVVRVSEKLRHDERAGPGRGARGQVPEREADTEHEPEREGAHEDDREMVRGDLVRRSIFSLFTTRSRVATITTS